MLQSLIIRVAATGCAAAVLLLSACSNPGEDVRVTLCKDMVLVQRADNLAWTDVTTKTPGYNDAQVSLRFSAAGGDATAVCYFPYDQTDDTLRTSIGSLSAYSTSPSKMILDGRTLSRQQLAEAVKNALIKQARSAVDGVRRALN